MILKVFKSKEITNRDISELLNVPVSKIRMVKGQIPTGALIKGSHGETIEETQEGVLIEVDGVDNLNAVQELLDTEYKIKKLEAELVSLRKLLMDKKVI